MCNVRSQGGEPGDKANHLPPLLFYGCKGQTCYVRSQGGEPGDEAIYIYLPLYIMQPNLYDYVVKGLSH